MGAYVSEIAAKSTTKIPAHIVPSRLIFDDSSEKDFGLTFGRERFGKNLEIFNPHLAILEVY